MKQGNKGNGKKLRRIPRGKCVLHSAAVSKWVFDHLESGDIDYHEWSADTAEKRERFNRWFSKGVDNPDSFGYVIEVRNGKRRAAYMVREITVSRELYGPCPWLQESPMYLCYLGERVELVGGRAADEEAEEVAA